MKRQMAGLALAVGVMLAVMAPAGWADSVPSAGAPDSLVGEAGSGAGQIGSGRAVAVDSTAGLLYVADSGNDRVAVFDADTHEFVRAFGWGVADATSEEAQVCTVSCFAGIAGNGAGQLNNPTKIAVDNDPASASFGDVFVYEISADRVQRFTAGGEFVLMFGKGVNSGSSGNPDLCTAAGPPSDVCGAGSRGSGAGQLSGDVQLAMGWGGIVHVADSTFVKFESDANYFKKRVQKFEASGAFAEELILDEEPGRTRGLAVESTGDFYVANSGATGAVRRYDGSGNCLNCAAPLSRSFNNNSLAIGEGDQLFVVDFDALRRFNSAEEQLRTFYGSLQLPAVGIAPYPHADGDLYAIEEGASAVHDIPLPPPGPVVYPRASTIFANPVGSTKATLHAEINPDGKASTFHFDYVDQESFESEGGWASPNVEQSAESAAIGSDFELHEEEMQITGLAPETVYRFRAVAANSDGTSPGPDASFETLEPIEFGAVWSDRVGSEAATLHTEVNPLGSAASGHFQWVEEASFEESGFAEAQRAPLGEELELADGEESVDAFVRAASLAPGSAYRYRLVATNRCKPDPEVICSFEGPVGRLVTFAPASAPPTACPANAAFRKDAAAQLPDCRGYEMVSPVDKAGADVLSAVNITSYPTNLDKGAGSGQRVTYSVYRAFAEPEGAPYSVQFLSARGSGGWSTKAISPPREGPSLSIGAALDFQFKAFSEDLCFGWFLQDTAEPLLAPGAAPDYPNLYRRTNCGAAAGSYEALTTAAPASPSVPELQGFAGDGETAVFGVTGKLTADAFEGKKQAYEAEDEGLALVCVLADGSTANHDCGAGSPSGTGSDRLGNLFNAVSEDGERIYWTGGPTGALHLRIGGTETVEAPESAGATFHGAAADGSRAIFATGSGAGATLYEFELASEASSAIAAGLLGVAGVSEDGAVVYFASSEVLAAGASEGEPNLYRAEAGEVELVARLTASDAALYGPLAPQPFQRVSRVSPDGEALVFMSRASLTGYDNTDAASGEADAEVFLYDSEANGGAGQLRCVSCNPSGARPRGELLKWQGVVGYWIAGSIPPWTNQLTAPRVLSDDARRLYFNSFEALVAGDTNGRQDVYQWEAPGKGDCVADGHGYVASAGGCISLISSGQSPEDSSYVDSSTSGDDVFFKTAESLDPRDPGLIDIYDARVSGGFAPSSPAPLECEGQACQHPAPAPGAPTPSSATFVGPGNPAIEKAKAKKRCPKGKHKVKRTGKVRCVKNKGKGKAKKARRASHRRPAR